MTTRMVLLLCTAATAQECVRGNCRGPDTYGVFNYASGAEYEGTWNGEGLRHGLGVWHAPHGASRYAGEFVEGKKQGVGVKTLADGGEVAGEGEAERLAAGHALAARVVGAPGAILPRRDV